MVKLYWIRGHVGIVPNKEVDRLAKLALTTDRIHDVGVISNDYFRGRILVDTWQMIWEEKYSSVVRKNCY